MTKEVLRQSFRDIVRRKIEFWIAAKVSRKAKGYFLRSGDLISVAPLTGRYHEPDLTTLITQAASDGHADFLLDIGANIGLVSLQCGNAFKVVHGFEPNPELVKILEVNTSHHLKNFYLHPFGIAALDGNTDLWVPSRNDGGAFIRDGNNYSDQTLAEKDDLTELDQHRKLPITLKKGRVVFSTLFAKLKAQGLHSGVIKIDVEGYEKTVLTELCAADRSTLKLFIVIENLDANIAFDSIARELGCGKVLRMSSNLEGVGLLRRVLRLLKSGRKVELMSATSMTGTLVLSCNTIPS